MLARNGLQADCIIEHQRDSFGRILTQLGLIEYSRDGTHVRYDEFAVSLPLLIKQVNNSVSIYLHLRRHCLTLVRYGNQLFKKILLLTYWTTMSCLVR